MRIKIIVVLTVYYWLLVLMANKDEPQNVYQFFYFIWCVIYFMGIHRDDQIRVAAYMVFPAFFIYQAHRQVSGIMQFYNSDGKTKLESLDKNSILSIITLMIYAFMLTYEQRKEQYSNNSQPVELNDNLAKLKEKSKSLQKSIAYNLSQLVRIILPGLRYFALLAALTSSLTVINIPNSILLLWSFILMKKSDYDYIQWPRFFCFKLFMILNLYIARMFHTKFQSLSVEMVSLFGVYANNNEICKLDLTRHH